MFQRNVAKRRRGVFFITWIVTCNKVMFEKPRHKHNDCSFCRPQTCMESRILGGGILSEKPIFAEQFGIILSSYVTRIFFVVFRRARHLTLSWAIWLVSTPHTSFRYLIYTLKSPFGPSRWSHPVFHVELYIPSVLPVHSGRPSHLILIILCLK